jgi:transcriptional regulator with XRE-family HTH domain
MSKAKKEDLIFNKKVARRLKELRVNSNPIQSQFAKENLVDRQLLNRWENENNERGISIHTIRRFCKMIDIPLKKFFDDKIFEE